jgi:short-subunit dehydrogenase
LGKALALELARAGHQLILCSRSPKNLAALKKEILSKYDTCKIEVFAVDLSDQKATQIELKKLDHSNYPNVVINNLGIFETGSASSLHINEIQNQIELNLYATIGLTNFFIDDLKKQKGHIINIGSVVSHQASKEAAAYSISKHALKAWNDSLREEFREFGVKVTAIYPGAMNTSSWDEVEQIDRNKMIQPEDVARLINEVLELSPSTLVEEIRLSPLNFN